MRKNIFNCAVLILCVLFLSACQNDVDREPKPEEVSLPSEAPNITINGEAELEGLTTEVICWGEQDCNDMDLSVDDDSRNLTLAIEGASSYQVSNETDLNIIIQTDEHPNELEYIVFDAETSTSTSYDATEDHLIDVNGAGKNYYIVRAEWQDHDGVVLGAIYTSFELEQE